MDDDDGVGIDDGGQIDSEIVRRTVSHSASQLGIYSSGQIVVFICLVTTIWNY